MLLVCGLPNRFAELRVAEAGNEVIVDHNRGLHDRVANRGTYKAEAALLQVFAHGVGLFCFCRDLLVELPEVLNRPSADETPKVGIETAEFLLDLEKNLSVGNRGSDFEFVAND